jgi:hypothetical protein
MHSAYIVDDAGKMAANGEMVRDFDDNVDDND